MIRVLVRRGDAPQIYCCSVLDLVYEEGTLWWIEDWSFSRDVVQIRVSPQDGIRLINDAFSRGFVDLTSYDAEEISD